MNRKLNLTSARSAGAQDLVIAIFAQAVRDYLGGSRRDRSQAAFFLSSTYAAHLAQLAGFSADIVWLRAQKEAKERAERRQERQVFGTWQRTAVS